MCQSSNYFSISQSGSFPLPVKSVDGRQSRSRIEVLPTGNPRLRCASVGRVLLPSAQTNKPDAPRLMTRFWSKVDIAGPDDCWEWQASTNGAYGLTSYNGEVIVTHRLAWLFTNGPIPDGLLVCHTCDNPVCVNPAHLFLGTHSDNTNDAVKKGRWVDNSGEAHGNSKLTKKDVIEIRRLSSEGKSQRVLGRMFGVDDKQIFNIIHRKQWTHI